MFRTREAPGIDFDDENLPGTSSFEDCRARLTQWLERLIFELSIDQPETFDSLSTWQEGLEETIKRMKEPGEPFNDSDGEEWIKKLEEALQQLEQLKEVSGAQQAEMGDLRKELDELKSAIGKLPRATWLRAAGNRMLVILDRLSGSKTGQMLAEKVARGLLGDGN